MQSKTFTIWRRKSFKYVIPCRLRENGCSSLIVNELFTLETFLVRELPKNTFRGAILVPVLTFIIWGGLLYECFEENRKSHTKGSERSYWILVKVVVQSSC